MSWKVSPKKGNGYIVTDNDNSISFNDNVVLYKWYGFKFPREEVYSRHSNNAWNFYYFRIRVA